MLNDGTRQKRPVVLCGITATSPPAVSRMDPSVPERECDEDLVEAGCLVAWDQGSQVVKAGPEFHVVPALMGHRVTVQRFDHPLLRVVVGQHRMASSWSVESKNGAVVLGTGSSRYRRLSPLRRCLNPLHDSVSFLRSSNRTCSFPASGSPTGFTPRPTQATTPAAVPAARSPMVRRSCAPR